jgi:hypothetical protein
LSFVFVSCFIFALILFLHSFLFLSLVLSFVKNLFFYFVLIWIDWFFSLSDIFSNSLDNMVNISLIQMSFYRYLHLF